MFIDTLEFTIPIDLCALYATLQEEAKSQLEFPASVNSYGTTQDANVLVALRANKVTFKVDGVSSNASIISKSECKTLKLSVFDVDRTLMQKNVNTNNSAQSVFNNSNPAKRGYEQSDSSSKQSRKSYDDSPHPASPYSSHHQSPHHSKSSNSNSHSHTDNLVNVKQEPEEPDLIEIEPDPEPDIVPKRETPFMQIDYSSDVPHTQTSQAALDRVSFPSTSQSQSSSSYHQNVPHVQDYSEPGPSRTHGDQSADDFLVFQEDNECNDEYEEADYSNDDFHGYGSYMHQGYSDHLPSLNQFERISGTTNHPIRPTKEYPCFQCDKVFASTGARCNHVAAVHNKIKFTCVCGKVYTYQQGLIYHRKTCALSLANPSPR